MASKGEEGGLANACGGCKELWVRVQRDRPSGLCDFVHEESASAQEDIRISAVKPRVRPIATKSGAQVLGYLRTTLRFKRERKVCIRIAIESRWQQRKG
jgi:hypothetical protein